VFKLRVFAKYWLPVLAWMALIYFASHDPRSLYHSARVIQPLMQPDTQVTTLQRIVIFARKCAHSAEFAVLAVLFWCALRAISKQSSGWSWRLAAYAMIGVIAYGITDEIHQMYVPTRQAGFMDVVYDAIGGAVGLLALWTFGCWRKWWQTDKPLPN
jgi:VanZ family protein